MILAGVDPGLRTTGLAVVHRSQLLARTSVRTSGSMRVMADAVLMWLRGAYAEHRFAAVAIEAFAHRPWLPYRVRDAVEMGALVERIAAGCEAEGWKVIPVDPAVSKRGYPKAEAQRKLMMPAELRNGHERDAFACALAARTEAYA